ncbi:sugar phosphate isomerase/epimerase family protein [Brevibacillus choshinensis]|uniref:Sugar phosphate isomerase/epimerase n=1 Tax=Brevibacillus choshinensis TaxID=54911 RepID=A0ABX7FUT6_BRECH|nr:sugar phosphate isomerase/epimerase [Brevibacillus choshinensis]QRG69479.1 sugar phosphate isomerase/epimerase [Brevibacillus choshinensis]
MKLSCQEHLVPGSSLKEKVDWLEQKQFAGIELWGFGLKDRLKEISRVIHSTTINISAVCAGYEGDLFSENYDERKGTINSIKELILHCAEINSPGLIVVPSFGTSKTLGVLHPRTIIRDSDVEEFGEILGEIGDYAECNNLKIYVEPINRYESFLFNKISQIAKACMHASSSALSILVDTFHTNIEEQNVVEELKKYSDLIGYVHLSDSNRLIPGFGHIDFKTIVDSLNSNGYRGYLSFECFLNNSDELTMARSYLLELEQKLV